MRGYSREAAEGDKDGTDNNDPSRVGDGDRAPALAAATPRWSLAPGEPLSQETDRWLVTGRAAIHAPANV